MQPAIAAKMEGASGFINSCLPPHLRFPYTHFLCRWSWITNDSHEHRRIYVDRDRDPSSFCLAVQTGCLTKPERQGRELCSPFSSLSLWARGGAPTLSGWTSNDLQKKVDRLDVYTHFQNTFMLKQLGKGILHPMTPFKLTQLRWLKLLRNLEM